MSAPMMSVRPKAVTLAQSLKLRAMLEAGPATLVELIEASGLGYYAANRWVKKHREEQQVFIYGWVEDRRGRMFTPVYRWGTQTDAPRAGQARTAADRMRVLRAARAAQKAVQA